VPVKLNVASMVRAWFICHSLGEVEEVLLGE
jgi:hypothetical protein